jgi:hypothetical protein
MLAYVITIETVSDSNKTTTLNGIYASLEAAKEAVKDIESIQKDVLADRHHCYKSQIRRSSKRCSKYDVVRLTTVLSYNGDVEETIVIKINEEAMFGFNK